MIRSGITCRHIMVQSVYILNILTGQYNIRFCGKQKDTLAGLSYNSLLSGGFSLSDVNICIYDR